ncbi:MAG: DUF2141 domain-containing protein [Pseudomonadota bacterium]
MALLKTRIISAALYAATCLAPSSYVWAQDADQVAVPQGACHDAHDGPVLQLKLQKLKTRDGQFRIELYPDDEDLFLEGSGKLYRYYTPVPENEDDTVCITVPSMGAYGLLIIHDIDMNSKPDFLKDGFGLSTNPKLALRRPRFEEARFTVEAEETVLEIDIQYVTGNKRKRCRGKRC